MSTQRLTDMDVRNPRPVVSLENDWISVPDDIAAQEILETERTHTALTELANRVDSVRDQTSLEAYQWSYKALTGMTPVVERKSISLESFSGTISKKSELAKAIRAEADRVSAKLEASLETYASDIKEDFAEVVKMYDQAHRKLRATDADIEAVSSKKIEVNHTRIFEMFMVKDVFQGKEPIQTIRKEIQHLERLVQIVGRGVERISKDVQKLGEEDKLERNSRDLPDTQSTMHMMFNRKAKVDEGQFETDSRKTRQPKKYHSGWQNFWMIFGAIMFGPLGLSVAQAINHEKKGNEAKVDNSLTDIHKFIRHVEGMDEIVDDLSGHVQDLVDIFKQVNESQESALNRRIVPVMELANFIMKQIVDITKGTDTLFTRLVRKHSK